MLRLIITQNTGDKVTVTCETIEIKKGFIIGTKDGDPLQVFINPNNVEKVEVTGYK